MDDLDRELRAHLDNEADDQRERGLRDDEATFAARRALGNVTRIREEVRAVSPWSVVDDFAQDVRYGLRTLVKHPSFAIVAALTLALGVGATTAIFSVVDAVLLRPLPYADADRLAMVWENVNLPAYKNATNTPSPGNFTDWRQANSTFEDLAAVRKSAWGLTGSGEPTRVTGELTTTSLFKLLRVDPILGRTFTRDEDIASPSRVVIIGHGLWVDRFGSNPSVVGQTVRLNDEPYVVVGVMPRGFRSLDPDDQLWLPLGMTAEQRANRGSHFLRVLGRLKPGASLAQAQTDIDTLAARATEQYPQSNTGVGATVVSLRESVVGDVRLPLIVLLGVVALIQLMVCANIGNLLLARASAREREFAVRAAVGASRSRLFRQALAESVVLSTIGGAAGLALAAWGVKGLQWLAPANLPRVDDLAVNTRVALFNLAVAIAAGVLSGLMPAWQARRERLHDALKDETRGSPTPSRLRTRNALVIAETALGVVVLVGAGLLLRSFVELTHVPVGFKSDRLLTFRVALPSARYRTEPLRTAFYKELLDRAQALPGVQSAAGITYLPLTMAGATTGLSVEGDASNAPVRFADFRSVSPGYFSTMSIPIVAGRDVSWSDTPSSPAAVVTSETAARTFWPNQAAIGKRLKLGLPSSNVPWMIVIGVVANVQQLDLIRTPRPAVYFPAAQDQGRSDALLDWSVRTAGDPMALAASIRTVIRDIDSTLPVTRVQTMDDIRSSATASQQFNLMLIGVFAVLALVLAAVGVYGVTAYSVTQRTRELGIRVALGARRGELLRLVLGHGARLAVAGLLVGVAAALALTRLMATMLFRVGERDPLTFLGVCAVLLVVSLLASLIPACRATRVDPVVALRS